MAKSHKYINQIKENYRQINYSDGVNKQEAIIIAQNYLINESKYNIISEINFMKPKVTDMELYDNQWVISFDAKMNVKIESGLSFFVVYVEKTTGKIIGKGWGPA